MSTRLSLANSKPVNSPATGSNRTDFAVASEAQRSPDCGKSGARSRSRWADNPPPAATSKKPHPLRVSIGGRRTLAQRFPLVAQRAVADAPRWTRRRKHRRNDPEKVECLSFSRREKEAMRVCITPRRAKRRRCLRRSILAILSVKRVKSSGGDGPPNSLAQRMPQEMKSFQKPFRTRGGPAPFSPPSPPSPPTLQ